MTGLENYSFATLRAASDLGKSRVILMDGCESLMKHVSQSIFPRVTLHSRGRPGEPGEHRPLQATRVNSAVAGPR